MSDEAFPNSGERSVAALPGGAKPFAGLRFAVILLSKAMKVGRDHLIHRKRSPFPYEGKDLKALDNWGAVLRCGNASLDI